MLAKESECLRMRKQNKECENQTKRCEINIWLHELTDWNDKTCTTSPYYGYAVPESWALEWQYILNGTPQSPLLWKSLWVISA